MERIIRRESDKPTDRGIGNGALSAAAGKAEAAFKKATYQYDGLPSAFPEADPGLRPFGSDVLVQIRTPRKVSSGGIHLVEESRETDMWNTQVAKVIAFGPVCFCNRATLEKWPEKDWAVVGEYVRVPKYGGDRWWVDVPGSHDGKALFALFNDLDLKGHVPEDKVLDMVAYI